MLIWADGKKKKKKHAGLGAVRPSSKLPSAHLVIITLQTPTLPDWTRQHISLSTPKHSAVTSKTNRCMARLSEHFSPACAFEYTLFPFSLNIQILVMLDCRRSSQNVISCNMQKDVKRNTSDREIVALTAVVEHTNVLWKHSLCFYKQTATAGYSVSTSSIKDQKFLFEKLEREYQQWILMF